MGMIFHNVGMRGLRQIILITAILALAPVVAAADFLRFVEDLPLAPGLVEDTSASILFDKPNGRIVRARASGRLPPATVVGFYRETLPQLGWQPETKPAKSGRNRASDLRFVRARESLSVEVAADGRGVVVQFAITPR